MGFEPTNALQDVHRVNDIRETTATPAVMITDVGSVAVLVYDARKSAEWYHDKLGFEIVGDQGHYVTVKPKGSKAILLHLCEKCDEWGNDKPGGQTGIWLRCGESMLRRDEKTDALIPASGPENVEKTYSELKEKGVEFKTELKTLPWGKCAIFKDPDGNEFEIS